MYAAESLLLRGYGSGALRRSWNSYLQTYFQKQPGEQRVLRDWFVTWLDAYFAEETHATELPQRRPVARSVTLDVHSALNEVFQALDLPGMSATEIEATVEHRIRLAGPRTEVSD